LQRNLAKELNRFEILVYLCMKPCAGIKCQVLRGIIKVQCMISTTPAIALYRGSSSDKLKKVKK
jgi:hypothetical protein